MKKDTKYRYEKRIHELEQRLEKSKDDLYECKQLFLSIFNDVTQMIKDGKQISQGYLISKFIRVFK